MHELKGVFEHFKAIKNNRKYLRLVTRWQQKMLETLDFTAFVSFKQEYAKAILNYPKML